jgi:hypothetical protein
MMVNGNIRKKQMLLLWVRVVETTERKQIQEVD